MIDNDSREDIVVEKSWGIEVWFENNELYCGKFILVNMGYWSSKGKWHYHKKKDETFFIIHGRLRLQTKTKDRIEDIKLRKGDSFRIGPGTKHRFTSDSISCEFIEVSTYHDEGDSFRTSE